MKYNCDRCNMEMEIDESIPTTFNGVQCTYSEYMEKTKNNPNVWVVCKKCLDEMPDATPYFERGEVFVRSNIETFGEN